MPETLDGLRQALKSVQEPEAIYGLLVDSLREHVWVVDEAFIFRYVSDYWCADMGYARENIIGMPISMIVHPDDLGATLAASEKVRAGEAVEIEYRALRKNGTYTYHRARVVPIRGPNGRIERGLGVSRDVTEDRERAVRLDTLNAFRQSIVENASVLALAVDNEGNVTLFNRAMERLTGYPGESVVGKHIRAILPDETSKASEAMLADHVRQANLADWEMPVRAADGTIKVCLLSPAPVIAATGVTEAIEIGRDVTAEAAGAGPEARLAEMEDKLDAWRREVAERSQFSNIIARTPRMRQIFETIAAVSDSSATVLIQGDTGTGKALVARAIHHNSPRREKPFIEVDCGALTETLLESELFGHVRGAFTGAIRDKIGRFELAHGGTIFLDEIGNLSLPLQVKLLRVVEEGKFERVGGTETISVDVRIVAATNEELSHMVDEGRFRKDLFYRLNVVPIKLPPLRERREDIPLLATHFLRRYAEKHGRKAEGFTGEAIDWLMAYDWPGNVRELENVVEQAVVLARGALVDTKDVIVMFHKGFRQAMSRPEDSPIAQDSSTVVLKDAVMSLERSLAVRVLKSTGGNKKQAAKVLGLTRVSLYNKIRKYKIKPEEYS